MFGFNLTTKMANSRRMIDVGTDDINKNSIRYLLLFSNEVKLYADCLCNIRCMHNKTDFDMGRAKDISESGHHFYMSFFEFKHSKPDECGFPVVADIAYKSVMLDPDSSNEYSGPLKTGYGTIDSFVNNYTVIRLDTKEIYSPMKMPFEHSEDSDELFFMIFMFYSPEKSIDGVDIINEHTISIDGETVDIKDFYSHERAPEIIAKVMQSVFDNTIIFIADTVGDEQKYSKFLEADTKNRTTVFIAPYME